jgi:hypothetical protein
VGEPDEGGELASRSADEELGREPEPESGGRRRRESEPMPDDPGGAGAGVQLKGIREVEQSVSLLGLSGVSRHRYSTLFLGAGVQMLQQLDSWCHLEALGTWHSENNTRTR